MIIRVTDVETTGLSKEAKIVEVATMDLVGKLGEDGRMVWTRGRAWSTLINPGIPIPPEASGVHHIVDADVRDAPAWDEVQADFLDGMDPVAPVLAAHHASYDRQFIEVPNARWIDTYKIALLLWPDAPDFKNQTLRYWLGLKLESPELAQPHRAAGDVYVTAAILARAFRQYIITVDDMVEISSKPALMPKLFFGEHAMKPIAEVPTSYLEWITRTIKDNPDVVYTAQVALAERREANRNRSPVKAEPPKEST